MPVHNEMGLKTALCAPLMMRHGPSFSPLITSAVSPSNRSNFPGPVVVGASSLRVLILMRLFKMRRDRATHLSFETRTSEHVPGGDGPRIHRGSRGETAFRIIVSNDGRVINAFSVKAQ